MKIIGGQMTGITIFCNVQQRGDVVILTTDEQHILLRKTVESIEVGTHPVVLDTICIGQRISREHPLAGEVALRITQPALFGAFVAP